MIGAIFVAPLTPNQVFYTHCNASLTKMNVYYYYNNKYHLFSSIKLTGCRRLRRHHRGALVSDICNNLVLARSRPQFSMTTS